MVSRKVCSIPVYLELVSFHLLADIIYAIVYDIMALIIAFVILFFVCYFVLGNPDNRFIQNPFKSLIALTMCLVFLTAGSWYPNILERVDVCSVLSGLGSISYELFLAHGFILFTIIPNLEIGNGLKFIVFVAGTAAGTVLLYWANKASMVLFSQKKSKHVYSS